MTDETIQKIIHKKMILLQDMKNTIKYQANHVIWRIKNLPSQNNFNDSLRLLNDISFEMANLQKEISDCKHKYQILDAEEKENS